MLGKKHRDILRQAAGIQGLLAAQIGNTGIGRQFAWQAELASKLLEPQHGATKLLASLRPHHEFLTDFERARAWHHDIQGLAAQADRYRAAAIALSDPLEKYRSALDATSIGWLRDNRWRELAKRQFFLEGCRKHGWVPHPSLFEWLDGAILDDMAETTLKSRWNTISRDLAEQELPIVATEHRSECLRQLLAAQGAGLHLVVCRAAYPEVEALAREHALKDPSFATQLESLSPKQKGDKISKAKNTYFDKDNSPLLELPISDFGGILGVEVAVMLLEKVFASCWSEHDLPVEDRAISRHYHAHGFPLAATFKDGLNAILLLDVAMQAFEALAQKKP